MALAESSSLTGPLASDISNAIVRLVREHWGKGPMQTKTLLHDDVVITVLKGGFTHAEKTLYNAGKGSVLQEGRRAMQDVLEREMRAAVERLTGRRVSSFMSSNHHDPDVSVEVFMLESETNGDGNGPVAVD